MQSNPLISLLSIPGSHGPNPNDGFRALDNSTPAIFENLNLNPALTSESNHKFRPGVWLNSIIKHSRSDWLGLSKPGSIWRKNTINRIVRLTTESPDINIIFLCSSEAPAMIEPNNASAIPLRVCDTLFKKDLLFKAGLFHESLRYGWYQEIFLRFQNKSHHQFLHHCLDRPDSRQNPFSIRFLSKIKPEKLWCGGAILLDHMSQDSARLLISRMRADFR